MESFVAWGVGARRRFRGVRSDEPESGRSRDWTGVLCRGRESLGLGTSAQTKHKTHGTDGDSRRFPTAADPRYSASNSRICPVLPSSGPLLSRRRSRVRVPSLPLRAGRVPEPFAGPSPPGRRPPARRRSRRRCPGGPLRVGPVPPTATATSATARRLLGSGSGSTSTSLVPRTTPGVHRQPPTRTNRAPASTSRASSWSKASSLKAGGRCRRTGSACGRARFPLPGWR